MTRSSVSAVILAAGLSSRMGQSKQLLDLGGEPMLKRVIDQCLEQPFEHISVIVGHDVEAIKQHITIKDDRFEWLTNDNFMDGMSTSLQMAVNVYNKRDQSIMVFLGDQPFLSKKIISSILAYGLNAMDSKKSLVIKPTYKGKHGHPVFFSKQFLKQLTGLNGDVGAKKIIKQSDNALVYETDDPFITYDIDTPQDYFEAIRLYEDRHY